MAVLLLLIFLIIAILLLLTALDRIFALPFLNPSSLEARKLLVAIEDLLLPMGSFPSRLLQPWASTIEEYPSRLIEALSSPSSAPDNSNINHVETFVLTQPTPGNSGSDPCEVPLPTEITPENEDSKPATVGSPTRATLDSSCPCSTAVPSVTNPTPGDSGSAPPIKLLSAAPAPSNFESEPIATPPQPPTAPTPVNVRSDTTTLPLSAEPSPDDSQSLGLIDSVHEPSLDSLENQHAPDSFTQIAESSNEAPCLEDQGAGLDSDDADTAAHRENVQENSRLEVIRHQKVDEDQRNAWEDTKKKFERIVAGQNERVYSLEQKNDELSEDNERLRRQNAKLQADNKSMKTQYENHLRILVAERESAKRAAETAKAGVEDRIAALKRDHKKETSDASFKSLQEQNSLTCKRKMVEDSLRDNRHQMAANEEHHEATVKNKNRIIKELTAAVRELKLRLETSEDLRASAKEILTRQLENQRMKKDQQIGTLNAQLLKSEDMVKSLAKWKTTAEGYKRSSQRLSDSKEEQMSSLREHHEHVVSNLKLDIRGLERTINANEAAMGHLKEKISGMESSEGVSGLKAQLRESQKVVKEKNEQIRRLEQTIQESRKALDAKMKEAQEVKRLGGGSEEQHEEERTKAVQNAVAEAAEKEKKKAQEHEKEKRRAVEDALRKATEEAKKKERQYEKEKKDAVEKAIKKAIEDAKGKEERHDKERDEAANNAAKKAAEDAKQKERQHEEDKKEAVKKALKEAAEDAKKKERQHEEDKEEAVRRAAKNAAEDARQKLERQLDHERKSFREAQENAIRIESNLRSEIVNLKSQVGKAAETESAVSTEHQPGKDTKESAVQTRLATDADKLILEIERNGLIQGSVEWTVLQYLNKAKTVLQTARCKLRESVIVAQKHHFTSMVNSIDIDTAEKYIQQLDRKILPVLIEQANVANARLRNLGTILGASDDIQKDAMLEAIDTPNPLNRKVQNVRGPKRYTKPGLSMFPSSYSTNARAESSMGQSQQATGNLEQEYDPRRPYQHQNVPPRPSAAISQGQIQGLGPIQFGGTAGGFASQPQAYVTPKFKPAQVAPGSANDGSSSQMPQRKADQHSGPPDIRFGATGQSDPVRMDVDSSERNEGPMETSGRQSTAVPEKGADAGPSSAQNTPSTGFRFDVPSIPVNNAQNSESTERSTAAMKDHRTPFAELMRQVQPPASSDRAATAVVPEPVRKDSITSRIVFAEPPAATPQTFPTGDRPPRPGFDGKNGATRTPDQDPSKWPKNKMRRPRHVNASTDRQLRPAGWTDSLTATVKEMLEKEDPLEEVAEIIQAMWFQTNDTEGLEQWLKKLQSDYEAEKEGRTQQE